MTKIAILFIVIFMVSCTVGEKDWISIPRKALIESVLEFELNSEPSLPPKSIAEVCTATGHYYYTSDTSSESSLLESLFLWSSPEWIAPIHLKEDDQRLYWYIWQQKNEQCVTSAHLFKYGLATYWDNIYIHSTQIIDDGPRLAAFNNDGNLDSLSKMETGLKLIEIGLILIETGMRIYLPMIVVTLLPFFIYQLYSWGGYIHKTSPTPSARHNTKEVTWVCVSHNKAQLLGTSLT